MVNLFGFAAAEFEGAASRWKRVRVRKWEGRVKLCHSC
jgi:hypothetical protein